MSKDFYTRDDIVPEAYNKKFSKVKAVLNDKEPMKPDMAEIMSDVTTFSYMFFQIDGQPLKLYPYQDLILNDKHRFKIFRASNQIGKSISLDVKAAYNLLLDHGHAHNEAIVSKSLPQSIFQMRRIKSLLKTAKFIDWKEEKGDADSMSVITCGVKDPITRKPKYMNMLICAPCTEGLLGYDINSLSLDEMEYWEVDIKHFFNQIAQPRTYSTKGDIMIFSNPNGQDNFVAELEQQTLKDSTEKKWHTYVFNYLDKPGNTEEEYEQLRHELSRQEFESTVDAVRYMSDRNYFTPDEIERSYDKNLNINSMVGKQPFFFLDVGAKHDRSVLTGGYVEPDPDNERFKHIYITIIHVYPEAYPINRVVGSKVEEGDGWHYEKSVKEYLDEWSAGGVNPVFGVDVTGNSGISPLFDAIGINPTDVVFSGPAKSGMYQRFKYFMEKGLLHRIKCKQWEQEASNLVVTKSARGYLLVNAASTMDRKGKSLDAKMKKTADDTQDSTAGLIFLADCPLTVTPTMVMI